MTPSREVCESGGKSVAIHPYDRSLDYRVRSALVVAYSGRESILDAWRAKMIEQTESLATALAGPAADPTQLLLANVAATAWLSLQLGQLFHAGAVIGEISLSPAHWALMANRIESAQRRLTSTIRHLDAIRKPPISRVSVNVAEVNVSKGRRTPRPPAIDVTPDRPE